MQLARAVATAAHGVLFEFAASRYQALLFIEKPIPVIPLHRHSTECVSPILVRSRLDKLVLGTSRPRSPLLLLRRLGSFDFLDALGLAGELSEVVLDLAHEVLLLPLLIDGLLNWLEWLTLKDLLSFLHSLPLPGGLNNLNLWLSDI